MANGEKRKRSCDEGDATNSDHEVESAIAITDVNRDFQVGDICLISSDGIVFKCWSYDLRSASAVFCTMLADHSPDKPNDIQLVDEKFESGEVVQIFLDAVRGEMSDALDRRRFHSYAVYEYAHFLLKWECPAQIETLKAIMRPYKIPTDSRRHEFDFKSWLDCAVFGVGAILDDADLCYTALRNSPHAAYDAFFYTDFSMKSYYERYAHKLDLRFASPRYLVLLPGKYMRALLFALPGHKMMDEKKTDWEGLAESFQYNIKHLRS